MSAAHAPSVVGRQVIVAFDGSPRAHDALSLALQLRDPDEGVLTLACVVPGRHWHVPAHTHRPDAAVPEEIEHMFADARAALIPAGIRVKHRAPIAPSAARGLTELAEADGADLVVISSSQHSEAGHVAIDRTAGRLLQGAPCAVAVPPAGMRSTEPFRHIGIAYDGSPEAAAALVSGYEIAARSGAAVTLLCALEPLPPAAPDADAAGHRNRLHAQELLDAAADSAPEGVNPRTLLLYGPPGAVIAAACDGIIDLLVTGSRGYGPLQRALLGSVSEALTNGASYPVLVLPRDPATVPDEAPQAAAVADVDVS
jgi:nucleotide-binding universal stress UspA family protein